MEIYLQPTYLGVQYRKTELTKGVNHAAIKASI